MKNTVKKKKPSVHDLVKLISQKKREKAKTETKIETETETETKTKTNIEGYTVDIEHNIKKKEYILKKNKNKSNIVDRVVETKKTEKVDKTEKTKLTDEINKINDKNDINEISKKKETLRCENNLCLCKRDVKITDGKVSECTIQRKKRSATKETKIVCIQNERNNNGDNTETENGTKTENAIYEKESSNDAREDYINGRKLETETDGETERETSKKISERDSEKREEDDREQKEDDRKKKEDDRKKKENDREGKEEEDTERGEGEEEKEEEDEKEMEIEMEISEEDEENKTNDISNKYSFENEKGNNLNSSTGIKLFMIDYKECQNKKCSCKKLYRFKKIRKVETNKKFKGIVLTPFCNKYFSLDDKKIIDTFGLSVIDCSWRSIDTLKKVKYANQRKLPYIIAVNSINYGKAYKLSCLESLAYCLYVCNYTKQCNDILQLYKWGSGFIPLNKELLDAYKLCSSHDAVKKAETEFLQKYMKEKEENKKVDQYTIIYEDDYIEDNTS